MRSPAAAIAWQFRQRHRWGLAAVLGAIFTLGAIKVVTLAGGRPAGFDEGTFALLVPLPLAAAFFYLLAVFTFGTAGDLAVRASMYPSRMLTLPVTSAALAGWPMLYGCLSMVLLWLAIRSAGIFPSGLAIPRYWPALFAASLLAWTQALVWLPYPVRGLRILASVALLVSINIVILTALETGVSETTMFLLLAPLLPLAYVTAHSAVKRARRGEVPDWRLAERLAPLSTRPRKTREFRNARRAQLWFEWRQYGRSLPLLVALVLPPGLSLLFVFREAAVIVIEIVVASLLLPPFLATFAAAASAKSSSNASESYGITPFLAIRPVEDRDLVVAKWQAALLSTLLTWVIVIVTVPLALLWSDAAEPIIDIARGVDDALGRTRATVLGLLFLVLLIGSTWKQLVQGLYIAMSGRDWAVKGVVFATLFLVTAAFFALGWILDSRFRIVVAWNSIPSVMAVFAALKLVLAARVIQRGVELALFTRKQLVAAAIAWDCCVLAVYGVLALVLPDVLVRRHFLLLVAMLVVPFVRLAAAPLAVAGNRHR